MLTDSPTETSNQSGPASHSARKRRWLRFSVRTMMIAVLVAAVALSWPISRANIQRRAVAALKKGAWQGLYRLRLSIRRGWARQAQRNTVGTGLVEEAAWQ